MSRGGKQIPLPENTRNEVVRLYRDNLELNVKGVAERVGCSTSTAWNILTANGIEIRGASPWQKERDYKNRILRRWDAGHTTLVIARCFKLQREGVARVIAANRPYDQRLRRALKGVFGELAETRAFLNSIASPRNAGRCAVCRSEKNRLYKNYCPQSGRFRDLLCVRCGQAIGCFNNDAAIAIRAAVYLIRHGAVARAELPSITLGKVTPKRYRTRIPWGRA